MPSPIIYRNEVAKPDCATSHCGLSLLSRNPLLIFINVAYQFERNSTIENSVVSRGRAVLLGRFRSDTKMAFLINL
jgi:hypothetical protein